MASAKVMPSSELMNSAPDVAEMASQKRTGVDDESTIGIYNKRMYLPVMFLLKKEKEGEDDPCLEISPILSP